MRKKSSNIKSCLRLCKILNNYLPELSDEQIGKIHNFLKETLLYYKNNIEVLDLLFLEPSLINCVIHRIISISSRLTEEQVESIYPNLPEKPEILLLKGLCPPLKSETSTRTEPGLAQYSGTFFASPPTDPDHEMDEIRENIIQAADSPEDSQPKRRCM